MGSCYGYDSDAIIVASDGQIKQWRICPPRLPFVIAGLFAVGGVGGRVLEMNKAARQVTRGLADDHLQTVISIVKFDVIRTLKRKLESQYIRPHAFCFQHSVVNGFNTFDRLWGSHCQFDIVEWLECVVGQNKN